MISLNGMEEELEKNLAVIEPEQVSKVTIPWDKIDEWIATIDLSEKDKSELKVVDPGDRRN